MKVTIIGAGNVGALTASRIIDEGLADVVLIDIVPGLAKGKALDISDARPIFSSRCHISGTEDFSALKDSDIVVITAGLTRKPGMSREELLRKNAEIIKEISINIKRYCGNTIVIIVTNPLDVMTYLALKTIMIAPNKIMGMAGVLDTARFVNAISLIGGKVREEDVFMLGSHGDTMVPIKRTDGLSLDIFKKASEIARDRGAEIVSYLKTGSAYFAPSAAILKMVRAILKDEKKVMCVSAYLNGEYEEKDICIGVPVILGSKGIEKIIEIELTENEKVSFKRSVEIVRNFIDELKTLTK